MKSELSAKIDDVLGSVDYQVEDIVLSLTGEFLARMELSCVSRTELAKRLDVRLPRVTRILQGNDNFTLKTVVSVADALDCRLVFALAPCGAETRWMHYFDGGVDQEARHDKRSPRIDEYCRPVSTAPVELLQKTG